MPLTPDPPFPKSSGDNIRSKDWNDAVKEVQRLDTAKLDKAGGRVTGPLSVDGLVGIGTPNPNRALTIEGAAGTYLNVRSMAGGPFELLVGADSGGGIISTMTNHDLQLRAGANDTKLIIKANGNVGIGTTNPQDKLHVGGGNLRLENNRGLFIQDAAGAAKRVLLADPSNVLRIGSGGGLGFNQIDLDIGDGGTVMSVKAAGAIIQNAFVGDVGHGPDWAGFSHKGAVGQPSYALLQRTDGLFTLINKKPGGGYIGFRVGNVDKMIIDDGGNIGIGTTAPYARLTLAGTAGTIGFTNEATPMMYMYQSGTANAEKAIVVHSPSFPTYGMFYNDANDQIIFRGNGNPVLTVSMGGGVRIDGPLAVTGAKSGYVVDQFVNKHGDTLEEGDVVVIGEDQASLFYGMDHKIPVPEVDIAQKAYDTRVCGLVSEIHVDTSAEALPAPDAEADESAAGRGAAKKVSPPQSGIIRKTGKKTQAVKPQTFTGEELEKLDRAKVGPDQIGLMVTLGAFAHCKVDADIAPIKVGDLLTTSPTKGHAQKVLDPTKAIGAIIGKALGPLKKGKGKIPVMVLLH
ncbi:MAG TPA: hypothetical protein VJZ26_14500 [Blastocatellia bacterium]|nr:hypothetical protein [Blastocatellia bacterium]